MKTNKVLIGGVVGAITFFILGYLIYGMLLMDFMMANTNQCMMKPMEEMNMLAMFASNLAISMLLAIIFSWANVSNMMDGMKIGAIVAALVSLSFDLSLWAMSSMFSGIHVMLMDVAVFTVLIGITGGVIAKVMNMGKA